MMIAAAGLIAFGVAVVLRRDSARFRLMAILFALFTPAARRPAPLDHFVRGALYQEIKREPGVHFEELRRRTELPNGQASHHLRILERAGLVRAVADGNRVGFYPTDARPNAEEYGIPPIDRQVRDLVMRKPGITQREIRAELGRSASVVSRSVGRLSMLGLVTTSRKNRGVAVFPRLDADERAAGADGRNEHPGI